MKRKKPSKRVFRVAHIRDVFSIPRERVGDFLASLSMALSDWHQSQPNVDIPAELEWVDDGKRKTEFGARPK